MAWFKKHEKKRAFSLVIIYIKKKTSQGKEKAGTEKASPEKASPGIDKASPEKKAELGEEEKAEAYFSQIKESYMLTKLKALTKKSERPSVINANGYANKWTAPSGNSLVAHFIKDAGGRYVFENDTSSGNLNLDFERVYELANSSDYWAGVVFSDSVTLETFVGEEQRLNDTEVMKGGSIFYCNAQEKDYFGKGILQPHLILEDLHQIFYPDSASYAPYYFERFKQ